MLEKGIQIDATQPSTIVIDWLDYDTDYVVIAAVRSKEGTVASDTAEITTAKDTAIDLGQGANTYIVSKAGTYSFTPEKVDGTPIDVDWCKGFSEGADKLTPLNENAVAEGTE